MTGESESPKSQLQRLREIALAGGPAILSKVEELVGVDVLRAVVSEAAAKARQLHVEEFFRLLAQHAHDGDIAGLLVELTRGDQRPHVYVAVAEGFDNMRRCLDERAKHAAAVLVAQELHSSSLPTEYFRTCSRVVADMPVGVLEAIRCLLVAWEEVSTPDATEPMLCRGNSADGLYWYTRTRTRDPTYVNRVRPGMHEWFRFSEIYRWNAEVSRGISALQDAGFGLRSEGSYQEFCPIDGTSSAVRYFEWDSRKNEWAKHLALALHAIPT